MTSPEQLMNNDSLHLPIYMDYSATTPVDPRVVDKMIPYLREQFGNPASRSHSYGWAAERAVEEARENVAALVNADPREIIWTSGATESDNLAIKGAAHFYKSKGKHIVTVKTEHKAVLDTCRELEREGFEVTYLDVKDDGLIDLEKFKAALRPDTILVSVMSVNNEIGVVQDIEAIGEITREKGIIFHVDAAQATGKIAIDLQKQKVDLMSFSAHKTYGPKGIGALYVRRKPRIRIEAQMHGGGHERGMRSGTLATHQIVGMGEAFRIAREEMATENERVRMLRDRLLAGLSEMEEVYVNGDMEKRVPHNLNISFNFVEGRRGVVGLGLYISVAGAVVRAARTGPQRRARAQLDPLHGGPLHDRAGCRLRDQPAEGQDFQAARPVAAVGNAPGRDRYFDHPVGSALTRRVDDVEFIELQVETNQGV
jgi:cysteine desulfurase